MSELLAVIEGEIIGRLTADGAGRLSFEAARDQALQDGLAKLVITPLAKQLVAHVRDRSKAVSLK